MCSRTTFHLAWAVMVLSFAFSMNPAWALQSAFAFSDNAEAGEVILKERGPGGEP